MIPNLARDSNITQLWHLQDNIFKRPKCRFHLRLVSPEAYRTPKDAIQTQLLVCFFSSFDYQFGKKNGNQRNEGFNYTLWVRVYYVKMF